MTTQGRINILKDSDDRLCRARTSERVLQLSISVKLTEPEFEGQTKAKLGNSRDERFC